MRGHDLFRFAAIAAVVMCYVTIILGGNVITTDNGLACPDWPTCFGNGNFLASFSGGAGVEWSHRVSAFFLSVSVLVLTLLAVAYERGRRALMRLSGLALSLVVMEALLGGVIIETSLLAAIVLVHLAIATVLFGLLLITALIANLKEMPRRWIDWARRAVNEQPAPRAASVPAADPSAGRSNDRPVGVSAPRDG